MVKRLLALSLVLMLAGCGGSSGGTNPPAPTSASTSGPITAAAGGNLTTSFAGQSVTVKIPVGALSADATVTLTVYAQTALPATFASLTRRAQSLPTGSAYIAGFSLSTGSATLLKPVSFTATTSTPASGTVQRLAGSNGAGFNDIDTATFSGGSVSNDGNAAYPGPSLSGTGVIYAFYSVPSANAAGLPALTIAIHGPSTVTGGFAATYTGVENGNGFPFLGKALTYGVDTPAIGSIGASTGVFTAVSFGQPSGNITATDPANSAVTAKYPVQVLSTRPATVGDSLTYSGTLSKVLTNYSIATPGPSPSPTAVPSPGASPSPTPVPPTPAPVVLTQSAKVSETVSVASVASPAPGTFTVKSDEIDTYPLSTIETKTTATIAYQTSGASTNVREQSSVATDSNGSTYENDYTATSGLLAVLPEAGSFGPNDASGTYIETDPGISGSGPTEIRTTASNGSYNDAEQNADGSVNVATANADFSGSYSISNGFTTFAFAAPTTGSSGTIAVTIEQLQPPNYVAYGPPQMITVGNWIPAGAGYYTETDTAAPSTPIDAACAVPAKFGSTATLVTQTSLSIDPIFGTADLVTTKSFDVAGVGTACIELNDQLFTQYDYTGQLGVLFAYASNGGTLTTSTYTETLTLQSATVAGQPSTTQSIRGTTSVAAIPAFSRTAVALARERFVHAVRLDRNKAIARRVASLRSSTRGVR